MNTAPLQLRRYYFIKLFESIAAQLARYLFLTLGLIALLVLLASLFTPVSRALLSFSFLALSPALFFVALQSYVAYLRRNPGYALTAQERRIFENNFNYDALSLLTNLRLGWKPFWATVYRDHLLADFMLRFGLSEHAVVKYFPDARPNDGQLEELLRQSMVLAEGGTVSNLIFLEAIFTLPPLQLILERERVSLAEMRVLIRHYSLFASIQTERPVFEPTGGIARDWAVGYTNLLDRFTQTLPGSVSKLVRFQPLFGRSTILDQITRLLVRGQTNSLVITGEEGVGKTEIFYHLADRIIHYQTHTELDGFSVRVLDAGALIGSIKEVQQAEQLLGLLFSDIVHSGNVVVFIDDIHRLLDDSGKPGTLNIATALLPYLQNPTVRIVGATSSQRYAKIVATNPQLAAALPNVEVPQPEVGERLGILLSHIHAIERQHHVFFLYESLKVVVEAAARYLPNEYSPERELRLVEEIAASPVHESNRLITPDTVEQIVGQRAHVPVRLERDQQETVLNLEKKISERIIGQEGAIRQISNALLRARAGLRSGGSRPIGSFLFLGPTGVGKTETAKVLAAEYFGESEQPQRLDLAEYAGSDALEKLLGRSESDPGELATLNIQRPASVLLLDEIEKATPQVRNVFLRLLDEGKVTTNFGKVLDFSNTIVIATSNAGSQYIKEKVESGFAGANIERELIDKLTADSIFATEFLNRFDGVVVFLPLSPLQIRAIVKLRVDALIQRLKQEKGVTLNLSPAVLGALAEKGYDPVFGARALDRVIKSELETVIARRMIEQNVQPGSSLTIETL